MKEKIINLRKKGYTYDQISEMLNCSKGTISYHCKKIGLGNTIIDNEMVKKIKEHYNLTKDLEKTAKKFNISISSVRKHSDYVSKKPLTEEERKKKKIDNVISWRKRTKRKLIEYKGGECEKCGYNKCDRSLEFHHLDPNEKDFGISGKSWSFDRLKKEVDKCILVCSNCHGEIHHEIEERKE